ncbi:MAG: glycosyltransferase family 2 protein [Phycisphaerales bacterium]
MQKIRCKSILRQCLVPFGMRLGTFVQHAPRALHAPNHPCMDQDEGLPSLCIVTPSLNQGRFLQGAIDSVLDQQYPALEYVVRDGGSSDETVDVLKSSTDRLTSWESQPDNGQASAINAGFKACGNEPKSEIMAWLNADDRLLPGSLQSVGRFFRDHPEVDVVYGNRLILNESGEMVGRWVLPSHTPRAYMWRDYVPQETLFWRRSVWERAGGEIDESLDFAVDWDLLIRLGNAGARFHHLPEFIGAFTTHAQQKSLAIRTTVGIPEFENIQRRIAPTTAQKWKSRIGSGWYMVQSSIADWKCTLTGNPTTR